MKVLFLFATIIGITYSAPQAPPTVPTPPTAPTLPPIQLFTLVYLGGICFTYYNLFRFVPFNIHVILYFF